VLLEQKSEKMHFLLILSKKCKISRNFVNLEKITLLRPGAPTPHNTNGILLFLRPRERKFQNLHEIYIFFAILAKKCGFCKKSVKSVIL